MTRSAPEWSVLVSRALSGLDCVPAELAAEDRIETLCRYLELVTHWGRRHDLTAARSDEELVDLFVADAAVLAAHVAPGNWVDVGSGAGAPGLPLALLRPELDVTLVEPRVKRVAFLRTAVGTFASHVKIQRTRVEALANESFDVAVSRATLPVAEWLRQAARIARSQIWLLVAQAEPPGLPGWRADLDLAYRWPLTGMQRRAIRLRRASDPAPPHTPGV
jgi:16S rRNA (guanine527-N7)-methyltransferase